MGHYVNTDIRVGFRLKYNKAVKPFIKVVEEQFHMEPRFDPKTGAACQSVKVVDKEASESFKIGEYEYSSYYDLFDTLAASCHCQWGMMGSMCDDMENNYIAITVKLPKTIKSGDGDRIGGSFKYSDVMRAGDKLGELKRNLESLGYDLSSEEPEVMLYWHHG
jgi:hypothetical protein